VRDPAELLDVDVDQVAGIGVLVAVGPLFTDRLAGGQVNVGEFRR
jgi:hypothetical protein